MQVFDLQKSRSFSPDKLKKNNLAETERFFCDLYCLEPGQEQKPHLHDASDKIYIVLEGRGSFRVGAEAQIAKYHHEKSKSTKHDHVVFHMSNGSTVTFNDPRRFGSMKLVPRAKLEHEPQLASLGPEPLGNEFDAAMLAQACQAKKTSLKAALSDQRVVAGLGNIYVCEALYRARLSPKRMASTIAERNGQPNARAVALVDAIKSVLNDAIKAGGSSLRDHRRADGSLGDFQHNFQVYDREGAPCPSCKGKKKTTIKRIVQVGRSTFYCPRCQK